MDVSKRSVPSSGLSALKSKAGVPKSNAQRGWVVNLMNEMDPQVEVWRECRP